MKYYYDLHIHTVLSPCADVLMTPNNLWNMVSLKGLDFVAFVDHNSSRQLPMLAKIGESYKTKQIYGIEVSLFSGIHVLCYFKHLSDALVVGSIVESHLPCKHIDISTPSSHLTDEYDAFSEMVLLPLGENTNLSISELQEIMSPYEHLLVLAHLNRYLEKGVEVLSLAKFDAVEWSDSSTPPIHVVDNIPWIYNSDAHDLVQILEKGRKNVVDLECGSIDCFFEGFYHG
jgi:PHP family Zn ribbon phosphoesterase